MGSSRLIVVAAVLALVGRAAAQPPAATGESLVADTARVVELEADETRKRRLVGGVALIVLGSAAITGGVVLARTPEGGGLVDLSPITRGFGYAFIAAGGLNVIGGTLFFFSHFEPERRRDGLREAIARGDGLAASLRIRHRIADEAASERRTRGIMRGAGIGLVAASAIAGVAGFALRDRGDADEVLYVSAVTGGVIGGTLWASSYFDGPATTTESRFQMRHAGLAPTGDGALLSFAGSF